MTTVPRSSDDENLKYEIKVTRSTLLAVSVIMACIRHACMLRCSNTSSQRARPKWVAFEPKMEAQIS